MQPQLALMARSQRHRLGAAERRHLRWQLLRPARAGRRQFDHPQRRPRHELPLEAEVDEGPHFRLRQIDERRTPPVALQRLALAPKDRFYLVSTLSISLPNQERLKLNLPVSAISPPPARNEGLPATARATGTPLASMVPPRSTVLTSASRPSTTAYGRIGDRRSCHARQDHNSG